MRGVAMYAPGDVRVEDRPESVVLEPTDAVIRLSATCICGSDPWPYRGADQIDAPSHPGRVYDLDLPQEEAPTGYRAMDARQTIKVMLRP